MSAESRDREDFEEWKATRVLGKGPAPGNGEPMVIPDGRPAVKPGEVFMHLLNEMGIVVRRCNLADAFEKKVTEAAKSPAAWLLLREELNPSKDVTP